MSATDSPTQPVLQAVSSELDDFLVGLFDTPPSGTCSNNPDHSIREGQVVHLAITVDEDTGFPEPRHIHCQKCGRPSPESVTADDWVAICDGYATPVETDNGVGECLLLKDTSIKGVYPVSKDMDERTDALGNPRSK